MNQFVVILSDKQTICDGSGIVMLWIEEVMVQKCVGRNRYFLPLDLFDLKNGLALEKVKFIYIVHIHTAIKAGG